MSERGVAYFYAQVRDRGGERGQFAPQDLREALPNRTYTIPGVTTFTHSDVALVGRVTAAAKGPAFAHTGEDDVIVPVDFDDPSAAERAVDVHVVVDESFGNIEVPRELTFRMGLIGAKDSDLFIDGLSSLGRIAVVLKARQDRDGEALIPTEQGALIGQIDDAGRLSFPGLGDDKDDFIIGISTVDAFRAAASEPSRRVVLELAEHDE